MESCNVGFRVGAYLLWEFWEIHLSAVIAFIEGANERRVPLLMSSITCMTYIIDCHRDWWERYGNEKSGSSRLHRKRGLFA